MRRFLFLIAVCAFLAAGCNNASPLESPAAHGTGISASVQNDSTPVPEESQTSAEGTSGGIMIGSGT